MGANNRGGFTTACGTWSSMISPHKHEYLFVPQFQGASNRSGMISAPVKENQLGVIIHHSEVHVGHLIACPFDVFVQLLARSNGSLGRDFELLKNMAGVCAQLGSICVRI
jgi:hypothetical protein